jgi:hypothetical protein
MIRITAVLYIKYDRNNSGTLHADRYASSSSSSSSSMALQPGVGLGHLYNVPPSLSILCPVFPFI